VRDVLKGSTTLALLAVPLLAACGPRQPGAEAGKTYYWQVQSSTVDFNRCTDDPAFRADLQPIKYDANSYFIYKVETGAASATVQNCTTFNPKSCAPVDPAVTLNIAANEYVYSTESRSPVGTQGCNLLDSTTWSAIDQGETMDLTITHVLSLVDNAQACNTAEASIIAQSPNMTGLQGCVVTFKIGAKFDGR
jgi:hypothetical protein